jgi:hypothetical protein
MTNLQSVDKLITGPGQRWMSFHHEWTWILLNLPDLVANLKTLENENLLLGIRELVGDRRTAKVDLIRFTGDMSKNGERGQRRIRTLQRLTLYAAVFISAIAQLYCDKCRM